MFEKKINDAEKKRMNKEAKNEAREAKKRKRGSDHPVRAKMLSIVKVLVVPALFAGIVSVVIYIAMENKVAEAQLKTHVVVVKESVAKNTVVTPDEIDTYFEEILVELTAVPEMAYRSLKELPKDGFYVENTMGKSQMVLKDDIAKGNEVMDKYKNSYTMTSFAAESFVGGVNGSLRRGDIVNVYAIDPATELLTCLAENVYVADVYDSSGNKVSDPEGIAASFTVYVTPEEVEYMNLAVVYGGVQIYLVTE